MNPATRAQVRASDPQGSVWLSANAGSGKTRVLTNRVARLLLDGVDARHILCLTYTTAAATEMQNRLFRLLGSWAMKDDADLRGDLTELGTDLTLDSGALARARRLFASAIETPGGLRIQTIHSFCASLLRRFPLEAGVSPQFREMDERDAALLRDAVVDDMAAGKHQALVDALAAHFTGEDFTRLTAAIIKNKTLFSPGPDDGALRRALKLAADDSLETLLADVIAPGDAQLLQELRIICTTGKSSDLKLAEKLAALDPARISLRDLPLLESAFLTSSGKTPYTSKSGKLPTKDTRVAFADKAERLDHLMDRIEEGRKRRLGLQSLARSAALVGFSERFVAAYEARKLARGQLDFDDLILKARALLRAPLVAQWVLFRLDGGIDHILVDEAQDTSPAQWDVIEALAEEFTAGEGARSGVARSLFVVGDKKQSIYSFQGADPESFDRMSAEFGGRFREAGLGFNPMTLEHSFRSAPAILQVVDACFARRADGEQHSTMSHIAFKDAMPGRVDLWPVVAKPEKETPGDWYDPVDKPARNSAAVVLAKQVAQRIKHMIKSDTIPCENGNSGTFRTRRVKAGDFLILVQGRQVLFHEIIAECKALGLPIAGADKLKIGAELAVKDIRALLSFLATPEDDLSLAAALRSPLLGWSEQDLHALAQPRRRGEYLWQALRENDTHPNTRKMLSDLLDQADFLRPWDLIERILTHHDGRRRLIARMGAEVEDGLDVLLSQAEGFERSTVPSLTGFLTWLDSGDIDIKRQPDSAGNRIRVMTVHGAKGLEAPIVILPDTGDKKNDVREEILTVDGIPLWKPVKEQMTDVLISSHEAIAARQLEEKNRLLYVAMTRAEKWLIVAAAGDVDGKNGSWYRRVEAGLTHAGAVDCNFNVGTGLRFENGDWSEFPDNANIAKPETPNMPPPLPAWIDTPVKPPAPAVKPLSPSELGGTKIVAGDDGLAAEDALLFGAMVHHLLEVLPVQDGPAPEPLQVLESRFEAPEALMADAVNEALNVVNSAETGSVFATTSPGHSALAEVTLSAPVPPGAHGTLAGARIHGAVDRLLVTPGRVLAVDFKTNRNVPADAAAVPEGILRQMGAYAVALAVIFPDHQIECAILWTNNTTLMSLPHDLVTAAFERAGDP